MTGHRPRRAALGRRGWAMLGAVYLFWGSTFLSIRVLVQQADPLSTAGVRFAAAGALLLLGIALVNGVAAIRCAPRDLGILAVLGLLHFLIANGLVSIAEQRLESGSSALLFATVPLFAAGMQLGGGDPARALVSGLLGLGGVSLVLGAPLHGWGRAEVLVVVAAAVWAGAGILARRLVRPAIGAARASSYQMLFGGLALIIAAAARGENLATAVHLNGAGIAALTHLILLGSLAGFFAYQWCLTNLPAPVTTSHAYVNPIVALILGAVLLDEPIGPATAAGALVVSLAVALCLTTRPTTRPRALARLESRPPPRCQGVLPMTTLRSQLITVLGRIKPTVDVAAVLERNDDFMLALNLDSLDAVELTTHLSEDFGVEFGDEPDDLDALVSLSALELLVERRRPLIAA